MPRKVLIANRSEIACRIAATCRRLGVATVAVHSEADRGAPHVRAADESVEIGPPPVRDSYLAIDRVIAAARSTGCDAVHPGYGLLSEKAAFARAVRDAGMSFIGPSPEALDALGDKLRARGSAIAVGVLPVPGTDGPVAPEDAAGLAERIGYPLIVKAVGGGGGIGMQVVDNPTGLARALRSASDRGKASFADDRVYLERYVREPRHVEVQILADSHGHVVALGERECTLQRRHQKIVEESPSPGIDARPDGAALRAKLLDSACRVARTAGYVGAGTAEFLLTPDGEIFFLEVNARLQVEHPVTELATGLDLVEQQLRIADGQSLDPDLADRPRRGHAVEARIYAENPAKSFAPAPGMIDSLAWPTADVERGLPARPARPPAIEGWGAPVLRLDSGIESGMAITPYYDPILAKMIAWAPDRATALSTLAAGLAATTIAPLVTNVGYLAKLVSSEEVREGRFDTTFAERFAKKLAAG